MSHKKYKDPSTFSGISGGLSINKSFLTQNSEEEEKNKCYAMERNWLGDEKTSKGTLFQKNPKNADTSNI